MATGGVSRLARARCLAAAGTTRPVTWQVHSPYARVRRPQHGAGSGVTEPPQTVAGPTGVFVASSPGVYTARAVWFGHDSEPLVLVVGLAACSCWTTGRT